MQSQAKTVEEYLTELPEDKKNAVQKLRAVILEHLPQGFEEQMSYGMMAYVVPFTLYPAGYHCDAKQPLPFINLAAQKNFIALYHMGLYMDSDLLDWFQQTYIQQVSSKLDMGKSYIRFKKLDQIPYALIGELASKMTPEVWIEIYERKLKK